MSYQLPVVDPIVLAAAIAKNPDEDHARIERRLLIDRIWEIRLGDFGYFQWCLQNLKESP